MAYQISVIGSFRKRYEEVVRIVTVLRKMGLNILSPVGSNVCKSIEDFVIFETDNPDYSPEEIQMITLEKILNSDAVYVCDFNGYVGKTTCYEIGFCCSRNRPLYFLEKPKDLPILVDESQIISPEDFGKIVLNNEQKVYTEFELCAPAQKAIKNVFLPNVYDNKTVTGKKKIVICGSMLFYNEMLECQELLRKRDIKAIIPKDENGIIDFYDELAFREFKRKVSSAYLKKIREKDTIAILVYNGTKKGQANYIGANTLVEIAMAFTWNRKIYLYNDIYEPLADELLAWGCICLKGNIGKIIYDMDQDNIRLGEKYKQLSLFDVFNNL
ncbi:hypothetical protein ACTNES_19645 [Blautia sp. HCP3S3_D9]|uniref:hypothetical protein n=1 Tax=Blautia sp. HCP3S3_D9 TaxID=3438912 RepID=UPI003F888C6B